jgi:hypothetical protein
MPTGVVRKRRDAGSRVLPTSRGLARRRGPERCAGPPRAAVRRAVLRHEAPRYGARRHEEPKRAARVQILRRARLVPERLVQLFVVRSRSTAKPV